MPITGMHMTTMTTTFTRTFAQRLAGAATAAALMFTLAGCGDVRNTPVPQDITQVGDISTKVAKLTEEEKQLFNAYVVRRSVKGTLEAGDVGNMGDIKTMTIGLAIANQREHIATKQQREADAKALAAKTKAEQENAVQQLNAAVTAGIVSKQTVEDPDSRTKANLSRNLNLVLTFKNIGTKEITMVKGKFHIKDADGNTITTMEVNNDNTPIKAGQTITAKNSKPLDLSGNRAGDEKFAETPEDKYKTTFQPTAVTFADGTTVELK